MEHEIPFGTLRPGKKGRFPFNQKFRFEFFGNFQQRVEQYFQKFPKRGQPREVHPNFRKKFPGRFLSTQLCYWNFQKFGLNGSHFGISVVSGISGNFLGKFLYHLPLFPNFRKFWWNGGPGLPQHVPLLLEIFLRNNPKSRLPFT